MSGLKLITGGQRSGKSRRALALAEALHPNPVFIATARAGDDPEFERRIQRHQTERGQHWTTVELKGDLAALKPMKGRVVVIDCITLWLSDLLFTFDGDTDQALTTAQQQWIQFEKNAGQIIAVTNEVGSGIVPVHAVSRSFIDLQGWMNQWLAARAVSVELVVCGIVTTLKDASEAAGS